MYAVCMYLCKHVYGACIVKVNLKAGRKAA